MLSEAVDSDVVLMHASRGEQRAVDVVGNNAHHHAGDIARILSGSFTSRFSSH